MSKSNKKDRVLYYKMLFTFMILISYMIGRRIPLIGIEVSSLDKITLNAQSVLIQTMTGDFNNSSIFTLGLWPYMLASMISMFVLALKANDKSFKLSPKKINKITLTITMVIAVIQAIVKVQKFDFVVSGFQLIIYEFIVCLELIVGMLIVIWFCEQNQKYGIGGRMAVFLVNVYSGLFSMLYGNSLKEIWFPALISIVEIFFMILLETTEKRIPVQRVSIHNIYADRNYIAYKLNPAGIMPVMFASAVFMVPQLLVGFLHDYWQDNAKLIYLYQNLKMTEILGIIVYLVIVFVLVIVFSLLMSDPWKSSDTLMKSGDSIPNIYAGASTRKYLIRTVFRLSLVSALILVLCLGVPLFCQLSGLISEKLAMLPGSIMMATGLWIMVYREIDVYRRFENYKPFI